MADVDEVEGSKEIIGASVGAEALSGQEEKTNTALQGDKERPGSNQKWVEIKMGDIPGGDMKAEKAYTNGSEHASETASDQQQNGSSPERMPSPSSGMSDAQNPPLPPEKDLVGPGSSSPTITTPHGPTVDGVPSQRRQRSDTQSTAATVNGQRSAPLSSIVFVLQALEQIAASKEARKKKEIGEAVVKALATINQKDSAPDPEIIFDALRLATETSSIPLTTTSLDCIGKLISYSYFSIPSTSQDAASPNQPQQPPLIERAIETICDCFQDEATPAEVQLQIVKSLLAAVLNDKIIVHGAGLLKAVRQIFNIFLLSKSTANQQVAQGTLTQMVDTVFERVRTRLTMKEARVGLSRLTSGKGTANGSQVDLNGSDSILASSEADGGVEVDDSSEGNTTLTADRPVRKVPGEKLTLQSLENAKGFDDARIGDNAPTMVTKAKPSQKGLRTTSAQQMANGLDEHSGETSDEDEEDEIYVKDAFLVFRSMCRLSTKQLSQDQQQDIKSSSMRTKLVSLAIIRTVLNNNMIIFTSPLVTIRSSTSNEPTGFGQAINHYLRVSLSKNGASSVKQVFEPCCEIFWLMLKYMRVMLKVSVPFNHAFSILCN